MLCRTLLKVSRSLVGNRSVSPCYFYRTLSSYGSGVGKEVRIPVPFVNGHIAGKIWESERVSSSSAKPPAPIICIGGWGDSVTAVEPLVPLLTKVPGQTILAFDVAGHGLSYHSPGPYSDLHMEALLSILRIIQYYSWDKVTILGHSFGGLVGLSFTSIFPELVRGMIGIEMFHPLFMNVDGGNALAVIRTSIEGLLENEKKIVNSVNKPPPSYTREEMIQRMSRAREPQGGLTLEGCDMLLDRGAKKLPDGKFQFTHDIRNTQFFWLARLGFSRVLDMADNITCPMLVVTCHGHEGGFVEDLPLVKELLGKLATNAKPFEHHKVSGTHHVHMLNPHVVAPVINQFLTKL